MNYIKRLQSENAAKDAEIAELRAGIDRLRAHLLTAKFHNDTRIETGDVEMWLVNIKLDALTAHDEAGA